MSQQQIYIDAIEKYGNNFSPSEFTIREGTSMTDIDYDFFVDVLRFRQWADVPMLVTSAARPGDDGAHGDGLALDFILFKDWLETIIDPWQQWYLATTWPFFGVGIYFDWHYLKNGRKQPAVGLHVDKKKSGRPLRWLRVEGDKHDKLYYYQNTKNGRFYNKKTQRSLELADVIEKVWQT